MKKLFRISLSLILVSSFFFCGFSAGGQAYADGTRYSRGGVAFFDKTDHIYYSYRVTDMYINTRDLPEYLCDGAGVCAVSAGGVALGYYDWDYESLIPNHTKFTLWGYEFYSGSSAGLTAMFSDLYTRMGTTSSGTTIAGYLAGMASYVGSRGYTICQTSAMSNGTLNRSAYKTALQDDKLMAVFFNGFAVLPFIGLSHSDGHDTTTHSVFTGNHAMMAYGYQHIKYYNANDEIIDELELLIVHAALSDARLCYVNVTQYGTISDAYITEIY